MTNSTYYNLCSVSWLRQNSFQLDCEPVCCQKLFKALLNCQHQTVHSLWVDYELGEFNTLVFLGIFSQEKCPCAFLLICLFFPTFRQNKKNIHWCLFVLDIMVFQNLMVYRSRNKYLFCCLLCPRHCSRNMGHSSEWNHPIKHIDNFFPWGSSHSTSIVISLYNDCNNLLVPYIFAFFNTLSVIIQVKHATI